MVNTAFCASAPVKVKSTTAAMTKKCLAGLIIFSDFIMVYLYAKVRKKTILKFAVINGSSEVHPMRRV